MTFQDVVDRAHKCVAQGCHYHLGKGGMDATAAYPWSSITMLCDCSGFAMWCVGRSRFDGATWWGTDQIAADATHAERLFLQVPLAKAVPGDLLVFPAGGKNNHGHVGVVTAVDGYGPTLVVHCSHGNDERTGDAVRETDTGVFSANGAIAARFKPLIAAAVA